VEAKVDGDAIFLGLVCGGFAAFIVVLFSVWVYTNLSRPKR
jgi:hypothetical protein